MNNKEIPKKVIKKYNKRNTTKYIQTLIAVFILALLYNFFIEPAYLVTGGINAVAVLLKYLFRINTKITLALTSLIFLIISYIFLGKEKTKGTLLATIMYPLFVYLTEYLKPLIHINMDDMLIMCIFIGVVGGVCNGFIYKAGFTNGGLPVISSILFEKFGIPIGKTNLVLNSILIIIGGYYFGLTMIMYAIIINYINSGVVDRILLGISKNKSIYIITNKGEEIKKFIVSEMNHSVTLLKGEGTFSKEKKNIILSVIPTKEYFQVTESIKLIDPDVFYVVSDAYEVGEMI
ncbi:MAG: YitT family protein [Bacilli bacterium]|nr:YitT family protein [Bacilli bacterium]